MASVWGCGAGLVLDETRAAMSRILKVAPRCMLTAHALKGHPKPWTLRAQHGLMISLGPATGSCHGSLALYAEALT